MGKFNFEDYRQPWETGPHWELKREFMEKYSDMFEEDRLLCLAQAYSNVVLMNCSYPAPVMQQISLLAKPLQMRKRFLGNTSETEASQTSKQNEKMKSIYEQSGRPFKQIRFCSSKEQSNSAVPSPSENQSESSLTKPDNMNNVSIQNPSVVQNSSPEQTNISQNVTHDAKSDFSSSDFTTGEAKILNALGLELVQEIAQGIKTFQTKQHLSALQAIVNTINKIKKSVIDFKFNEEPNCPKNATKFRCNVLINNCQIASEVERNKRGAKLRSAESAANVLFKLASQTVADVPKKVNIDESTENMNELADASEKNINCMKDHADTSAKNLDSWNVLQIFSENIIKRTNEEPALTALTSIAKSLNMDDCVRLDLSNSLASNISNGRLISEHTCKFYLNNILISCGKDNNPTSAKYIAVDSGFIKLSNLSEFTIHSGELKDRCTYAGQSSEVKGNNFEKCPFTVNQRLLASSLRDGFVLFNKYYFRKDIQKVFRNLLPESAGFCQKKFEYKCEHHYGGSSTINRAIVCIEGIGEWIGIADSKEDAKTIACTRAVEDLRKKYYTIEVKDEYLEGYIITRSQVLEGKSYSSNVISESNVGCKMLKSMGWTGGGLGSSGIAEPVEAQAIHSFGSGLGFNQNSNDSRLFKKRLDAMLQEFSRTETYSDLVFSKEFTKEERKDIHKLSVKYSLHTHSRGVNNERFLTVRHKYDVIKLLKYLASHGGSNSKFQLRDASKTSFLL